MNKIISLLICMVVNIFSGLEIHDLEGKPTNPLIWCHQSDYENQTESKKYLLEQYYRRFIMAVKTYKKPDYIGYSIVEYRAYKQDDIYKQINALNKDVANILCHFYLLKMRLKIIVGKYY